VFGIVSPLLMALSLWYAGVRLPPHRTSAIMASALPAWMAGCWQAQTRNDTLEEYWTVPRGGVMLGVSRLVHNDSLITYEQNRIEERGARIVLISHVSGDSVREYTATRVATDIAAFDTPGEVSEHIRYLRHADTLRVRFARDEGGRERGTEQPMLEVRCEQR
jgi:hypothetical protein